MKKTNCKAKSVGIIMDGNRRWAKKHGLSKKEAYKKGADKLIQISKHAFLQGVEHLAVYAFSIDNWNRSDKEVAFLMSLMEDFLNRRYEEILKDCQVRIKFAGDLSRLSKSLTQSIKELEEKTTGHEKTLWICFSYGGREDIIQSAKKACKLGSVDKDSISGNLWTSGMPDLDIIIRTGGQKRLSNFLIWQSVYAELFFVEKFWPEFEIDDFDKILDEFCKIKRNFGK